MRRTNELKRTPRGSLTPFTSRVWFALLALAVVAVLWVPATTSAQSGSRTAFRVVVHPDNPVDALTQAELSRLFLKKVTTWPEGGKVEPVDQIDAAPVRSAFSSAIHGRQVSAIKAYWNKVIFSGRGLPPPELEGDREIVAFVRSHPRGIGYVSSGTDTSALKVLRVEP